VRIQQLLKKEKKRRTARIIVDSEDTIKNHSKIDFPTAQKNSPTAMENSEIGSLCSFAASKWIRIAFDESLEADEIYVPRGSFMVSPNMRV
jgi:hypothetical protein